MQPHRHPQYPAPPPAQPCRPRKFSNTHSRHEERVLVNVFSSQPAMRYDVQVEINRGAEGRMAFPADKGTVRRLFCLFVCASLYFLTVDVLADVRVLELLGHDAVIPVHLMYLLFQCAGFLLFSVLDATLRAKTSGRWPVISLFVISGASLMAFLLVPNATAVVAFVDVCLLTSGMIGAFAYYQIAIGMEGSDSLGQFCGFAIATAAVMQILVIVMPLPELGRAGLLLLALCAVSACVLADGDCPTLVSPSESLEPQAVSGETTAPVLTPLAANAAALGTAPSAPPRLLAPVRKCKHPVPDT